LASESNAYYCEHTDPGRHFPWHQGKFLSFEDDEIRTAKLAIILQDIPGHEVSGDSEIVRCTEEY
jgi:hypothetical protein